MRELPGDVGGESWLERRLDEPDGPPNGGELLVEFGGRACYRSWEPGLNPNVTRVRTDQREYFANILRSAHGSVLEHANYSFALRDVSRVHPRACPPPRRLRFQPGEPALRPPDRHRLSRAAGAGAGARAGDRIVEQLEEFQLSAAEELGLDQEGVPFHVKKEVTSALRRLAPIGLSTDILWTANARTLRHVIEMRTAEGAEEELRLVFDPIARIMLAEAPGLFQDFERRDDGSWVPAAPQGVTSTRPSCSCARRRATRKTATQTRSTIKRRAQRSTSSPRWRRDLQPRFTGLKWASRLAEDEPRGCCRATSMLARIGLATSYQAISTVIAPGLTR